MMNRALGELARARAKLDAGVDRESVLRELGVDPPTWATEEEAMLIALADDLERGELQGLEEYRNSYRTAWAQLTGLGDLGPLVTGNEAAISESQMKHGSPLPSAVERAASIQRASFQLTKLPNPPLASASPAPTPLAPSANLPGLQPPQSQPKPDAALKETAQVDLSRIIAALPFPAKQPSAKGSLESALDSLVQALDSPAPAPSKGSTGTDDLDMSAVRRHVTPFQPTNLVVQAPPPPAPPPAPSAHAQPRFESRRPSTALLRDDPSTILSRPALPFREGLPPTDPAGRLQVPESTMQADSGAFQAMVQNHLAFPPGAAPPPVRIASAPARPDMTLPPTQGTVAPSLPFTGAPTGLMPIERYAQITAELEREADPLATFGRLGIQPDIWMATVRSYARLFAENTTEQTRFDALLNKARDNAR